jgi:hypothetical protein
MADLVVRDGIGYKRRNPWGVFGLTIVTLGVYYAVWYYKINNELKNYGVDNNPTTALLAILVGWVVIIPPFVSLYRTADRIRQAQERSGAATRIIPWVGLIAMLVQLLAPIGLPYYQTELNKVWDALANGGAEVRAA